MNHKVLRNRTLENWTILLFHRENKKETDIFNDTIIDIHSLENTIELYNLGFDLGREGYDSYFNSHKKTLKNSPLAKRRVEDFVKFLAYKIPNIYAQGYASSFQKKLISTLEKEACRISLHTDISEVKGGIPYIQTILKNFITEGFEESSVPDYKVICKKI